MEVLEHQAEQERQGRELEEREREQKPSSRVPYWLVGVLVLITAWLWLAPPSFLEAEPPPPPPVAEEEASLRFAMYLQAQRIRAFVEEEGRLPQTLEEAGPPLPGMTYVRLSEQLYQLTGATDRVRLTYRSDLPLDEFVGSGADVVDETELR